MSQGKERTNEEAIQAIRDEIAQDPKQFSTDWERGIREAYERRERLDLELKKEGRSLILLEDK